MHFGLDVDKEHKFKPFISQIKKELQLIQEGKKYFMPGHTKCFAPSIRSHSFVYYSLWLLLTEAYLPYWHFPLSEIKDLWSISYLYYLTFALSCTKQNSLGNLFYYKFK